MNVEARFWEIDLLRGVAVLMMIGYHIRYDLDYFGAYTVDLQSGFWFFFARAIATIFLLLVGISLTLSFSRATIIEKTEERLYPKYLKRGLKIFSWGLVITVTTRIILREGFVVFGILHLIGISIILAYPEIKVRYRNLVLGMVFIALGMVIKKVTVEFPWFLWLGLTPARFYSVDYFPLAPWFGVVLIGIFLGNSLYPQYTRSFELYDLSKFAVIRFLCLSGRHSLLIYLVHQPVLITVLYLLDFVTIGWR
ncbi:MAG: DUF1624 domain-containing protein [Methanophagales archaeon ANME-1-THS]|nr:MAG: DUF1624 domain-containing protein [Methanophagales archaeon ANME-1-THS]